MTSALPAGPARASAEPILLSARPPRPPSPAVRDAFPWRERTIVHPQQLAVLAREVAQMEQAIALMDRHAQLHAELRARGGDLQDPILSMNEIATPIAEWFGVTLEALRGRGRDPALRRARAILVFALYERYLEALSRRRWSLPHIGKWMADRDHTTILHLLRNAHGLLDAGLAEVGIRA